MEIREVRAERILNPTSIDLGDYVINPYRGCSFACLYCYAQFTKTALKDKRRWGDYVDVRINAPELLEKELKKKKPYRVLLGSTTECFLPVDKKYRVIKNILNILNENKIYFSILTRSPLIVEEVELLKKGFCESVYFTVNSFDEKLKKVMEPGSPSFRSRIDAVKELWEQGINVIPYFSPVLPGISDMKRVFELFPRIRRLDFEGLNFNLGNIDEIILEISGLYPEVSTLYGKMKKSKEHYGRVWNDTKKEIREYAVKYGKEHNIFLHELSGYFENEYNNSRE